MASKDSWKIVLGVCVLALVYNLSTFPNYVSNISGDGIPNRPQKEPPLEYHWDDIIQRVVLLVLSFGFGFYSLNKIRTS